MPTQEEIEAAAEAIRGMSAFTPAVDIARKALEAAERVRAATSPLDMLDIKEAHSR